MNVKATTVTATFHLENYNILAMLSHGKRDFVPKFAFFVLLFYFLLILIFLYSATSQHLTTVSKRKDCKNFTNLNTFLYSFTCIGYAKYLFWKMFKKILLIIFLNFFFYLKVQSFRLIMEKNFIYLFYSASRILSFKASIVYYLSA